MAEPENSEQAAIREEHRRYWRTNLRILAVLLTIWFAVSCGLGIFFVERLNTIQFMGFPLGFWFAQQGAIYVFIVLILVYALLMDREDRQFHVEEGAQADDVEKDS